MSWDEKEQAKKIREEYNIKYNNYMTLNLEQLNLCEDKETNASDFECESRTFDDRIIVGKDRKRVLLHLLTLQVARLSLVWMIKLMK